MRFPRALYQNNSRELPGNRIHSYNLMYARHKPGVEWEIGDSYPDFSKIKSDQSFNWSAFSLPAWARFTDQREYRHAYGVLGYSVATLRGYSKEHENSFLGWYDLKHDPTQFNYSHCELYQKIGIITKKQKRLFRMALTHKCKISLLPYQKTYLIYRFIGLAIMIYHRSLIKFTK